MNRTVSIITVVLDDKAGFEKTARSIMGQDYPGIEWIVIDGGSSDGTAEAVKQLGDRIAIAVSEPDAGCYDAMNKGLDKATGEWVNFMNAGDVFAETTAVSKLMASDLPDVGVAYGDTLAAYRQGPVLKKAGSPEDLDRGMVVCHQSVFVRTHLAKKARFDLQYRIGADYDQLLKLKAQGCRFLHVPWPVALVNIAGESNRNMAGSAREQYEIVRKYRKLSLPEKLYHAGFIAWVSLVSLGYRLLPEKLMHRAARLG
ncbi:MAG: glycosyltransferase family 2 protein [Bacteroidetes bacterium]|nr:glycosyltransferase family 2 protein [Bacteroidota bacterium]